MKATTITIAVSAGLSSASPMLLDHESRPTLDPSGFAFVHTFDLSNAQSWDLLGSPNNQTFSSPVLGEDIEIIGIGFDLSLSTQNGSWLSEAAISVHGQLNIHPGAGDDFDTPSPVHYSTGGIVDLRTLDDPLNFSIEDTTINIELFETFDDQADTIDAIYAPGSVLHIAYRALPIPSPTSAATLLTGSLLLVRRRR